MDYISPGGPALPHLSYQLLPARGAPLEQLLQDTHHVPGRRARHRLGWRGGQDGGRDGQLDTVISDSHVLS